MAGYDDMSFGKAFAAARKEKGKGKTFTWKGNSYSTNYKEETGTRQAPRTSERPRARDEVVTRAQRAIQRGEDENNSRKGPTSRPRNAPGASRTSTTSSGPTSRPRNAPGASRTSRSSSGPTSRPNNSPATPRNLKDVTLEDWARMSPAQRRELGLPNNRGAARKMLEGTSGNTTTSRRTRPGGSAARGYAKGGMVKANCGASMKPTQKGTKK